MHKLIKYACEELEDLERKVDKGSKLSMSELQYADTLAHMKKNLLKGEEMSEDHEYSNAMGYSRGDGYSRRMSYDDGHRDFVRPDGSYRYATPEPASYARGRGRGAKRDAMGRYSSADNEVIEGLMKLADHAPDEQTRNEIMNLMDRM